MDARPAFSPCLRNAGQVHSRAGDLALVGQEHLRAVLAAILGHGHLAGQLQAGAGDAVLRDDLDRPSAGQQVMGDPLALVAELEPGLIERGVGQGTEPIDVAGEVVHDPALLAAELQRLGQGPATSGPSPGQLACPGRPLLVQVRQHGLERLGGRLGLRGRSRSKFRACDQLAVVKPVSPG